MPSFLISDFSGGRRWWEWGPQRFQPNEASELCGFWTTEGTLRSMEGRIPYGASNNIANAMSPIAAADVRAVYVWNKTGHRVNNGTSTTNQTSWTIALCNERYWLDVAQVDSNGAAYSTQQKPDFRPIRPYPGLVGYNYYGPSFVPYGGYLYVANGCDNATGVNWRLDGSFYCVGKASCAGGTTVVTGTGTLWQSRGIANGSIYQGDAIYFKIGGVWSATEYRVAHVVDDTTIHLVSNGPNTGGSVDYIIVRAHKMGLTPPPNSPTCAAAAGVGLAPGTYSYKICYGNTRTGTISNPSAKSSNITITAPNCQITVNLNNTPTDPQVDVAYIYRSLCDQPNGPWYYVASVSMTEACIALGSYTDSTPDSMLGSEAPYDHDPPGYGMTSYPCISMREYNGRLYATYPPSGGMDNYLSFSSLYSPEYWPTYQFGIDDPASFDPTVGGFVIVADPGDGIMDMTIEGGSYESTGIVGGNMLILTANRAFRWSGFDWNDFRLDFAFDAGAASRHTMARVGPYVLWIGKQGPMRLLSGSNNPEQIHQKAFGPAMNRWTYYSPSIWRYRAVAWRDFYVIAFSQNNEATGAGNINKRLVLYHVPTDTWIPVSSSTYPHWCYAASLCSTKGSIGTTYYGGTDELYYGEAGTGMIYQLFKPIETPTGSPIVVKSYWDYSTSKGVPILYRTPLLLLASNPAEVNYVKRIDRIIMCFKHPAADQTITVRLFTDGEWYTPAVWPDGTTEKTFTITSSGTKRAYVDMAPFISGRSFYIEFRGETTRELELEWIRIDYTVTDDAVGQVLA